MDLKVEFKEEPVWLEDTANISFDSELNNGVGNEPFVKIERQTLFITPKVENDSRTEDDTVVKLKEETCDDEDNLGEPQLDDDGSSLVSSTAGDAVAEAEKIFLKEEEVHDSVNLSDGSRSSPSRLSTPCGGRTFQCSVCSKTYRREIYLERHALVHCEPSDTKVVLSPYLCVFCNKTFKRRPDYKEHMEMHSGVKKHECKVCNKKFGWRQSLSRHIIMHDVKKPFVCNNCPKSFLRSRDLQKHALNHLFKISPPKVGQSLSYVCNICNKKVKGRTHLKDHLGMHEGMMKYECNICHRKFEWRQSLRTHLLIHSASRAFPCKVCVKAFRRPSDLRRHNLTHVMKVVMTV